MINLEELEAAFLQAKQEYVANPTDVTKQAYGEARDALVAARSEHRVALAEAAAAALAEAEAAGDTVVTPPSVSASTNVQGA